MTVEERIARRLGRTAVVGLGASKGVPEGRLVSFGIAGALSGELAVGTVIDATRVVDEDGPEQLEPADDMVVVDDLMPDVDRRAMLGE